jgi:hypothetical protein
MHMDAYGCVGHKKHPDAYKCREHLLGSVWQRVDCAWQRATPTECCGAQGQVPSSGDKWRIVPPTFAALIAMMRLGERLCAATSANMRKA